MNVGFIALVAGLVLGIGCVVACLVITIHHPDALRSPSVLRALLLQGSGQLMLSSGMLTQRSIQGPESIPIQLVIAAIGAVLWGAAMMELRKVQKSLKAAATSA